MRRSQRASCRPASSSAKTAGLSNRTGCQGTKRLVDLLVHMASEGHVPACFESGLGPTMTCTMYSRKRDNRGSKRLSGPRHRHLREMGGEAASLNDWKTNSCRPCGGYPLMLLAVSQGLRWSPMLGPLGLDGGGFQFSWCVLSRAKTTLLRPERIRPWGAPKFGPKLASTDNALENMAVILQQWALALERVALGIGSVGGPVTSFYMLSQWPGESSAWASLAREAVDTWVGRDLSSARLRSRIIWQPVEENHGRVRRSG